MIHNLRGSQNISSSVKDFYQQLKDSIRDDILSKNDFGGLKYISDLKSKSLFSKLSAVQSIGDFAVIKSTTHYNQLMNNLVDELFKKKYCNLILIICNKEFNKRHKLFDSSSASLSHIKSTIEKLEYIIKPELFPKNIIIIEIDVITRQGELIETGYDNRTYITN